MKTRQTRHCVHYRRTIDHDTCNAGIKYNDVRVLVNPLNPKGATRLPCYIMSDGVDCDTCPKRRFPTKAEIRKEEKDWEKIAAEAVATTDLIRKAAKGRKGVNGFVKCPRCGQRLNYSIAGGRGHIAARCTTKDCISFME